MGTDNEDRFDRNVAKPSIDKAQANNNEIGSATVPGVWFGARAETTHLTTLYYWKLYCV
jgi:hypothetical protein